MRLFTTRVRSFLLASASATALLATVGCDNFFIKPTNNGGGGSVGDYFYVGTQTGLLAGFAVSTTGALSAIANTPFTFSQVPVTSVAVTPSNAFLYASAGQGIFVLPITAGTGAITVGNNSAAVATDMTPSSIQVDSSGKFLLAAGFFGGVPSVGVYSIGTGGILTEVGTPVAIPLPTNTTVTGSNSPVQLAILPNDSFIYVSMGTIGVVSMTFNTSGQLSQTGKTTAPGTVTGPTGPVSNQDLALALNSAGSILFVGETNAGVRVNTISSDSSLVNVAGSPFKTAGQPSWIAQDGTGAYLYVANQSTNNISAYSILASGVLTELTAAGSPFAAGTGPTALVLDQSKKFLACANVGGSPDLQVYSFDTTTAGKLVPGATAAIGSSSPATAFVLAGTH
jgi:6-phosphogluconolactonase (cycloisomerase 2 family)